MSSLQRSLQLALLFLAMHFNHKKEVSLYNSSMFNYIFVL